VANYNKVILMGNITRDIELKTIASGQSVAKIGLAVNRRWRTPEGEQREEVTYVDCDAWGKTAETMAKYLGKGRPVFIEGRLKLDQWQDKESGQNRSKLGVVIETFQFVDSRPGAGGDGGGPSGSASGGAWSPRQSGQPRQQPAPTAASAPASSAPPPMEADDIPF
jgi:single-strand DNA-binding protein